MYPPSDNPITIFMAGTPGAGKTEFSITLIETFGGSFIRIDADEIRERMRPLGYNGLNADIFQDAANKGVNLLLTMQIAKVAKMSSLMVRSHMAIGRKMLNGHSTMDVRSRSITCTKTH